MYETPPILTGSLHRQLSALRDYLLRLSLSLNEAEAAAQATQSSAPQGSAPNKKTQDGSDELRSLIVKTAHTVRRELDRLETELKEDYLAVSDFGSYSESVKTLIETTARQTLESYGLESRLEAAETAVENLSGQIRRGIITDPHTGERAVGIAISQKLSFTGETEEILGLTHYVLSPGQTLGLYTSSGWQFWINGSRRGWFDSADGMLHSVNLQAEQFVQLGPSWQLSAAGGFGIRCLE